MTSFSREKRLTHDIDGDILMYVIIWRGQYRKYVMKLLQGTNGYKYG